MPHIVTAKFKSAWATLLLLIGAQSRDQYNWHCGLGGEYIKIGVLSEVGMASTEKGL